MQTFLPERLRMEVEALVLLSSISSPEQSNAFHECSSEKDSQQAVHIPALIQKFVSPEVLCPSCDLPQTQTFTKRLLIKSACAQLDGNPLQISTREFCYPLDDQALFLLQTKARQNKNVRNTSDACTSFILVHPVLLADCFYGFGFVVLASFFSRFTKFEQCTVR